MAWRGLAIEAGMPGIIARLHRRRASPSHRSCRARGSVLPIQISGAPHHIARIMANCSSILAEIIDHHRMCNKNGDQRNAGSRQNASWHILRNRLSFARVMPSARQCFQRLAAAPGCIRRASSSHLLAIVENGEGKPGINESRPSAAR